MVQVLGQVVLLVVPLVVPLARVYCWSAAAAGAMLHAAGAGWSFVGHNPFRATC